MDKISHILPSSARVTASDVGSEQPVRPGAPNFGRPEGRNSLADRISISQKALESQKTGEAPQPDAPLTYKNPELGKQKIIEKMSQDFFNPKLEARDGIDEPASEHMAKSMSDNVQDIPQIALRRLASPQGSHGPQEN